jgi:hypothetical protein
VGDEILGLVLAVTAKGREAVQVRADIIPKADGTVSEKDRSRKTTANTDRSAAVEMTKDKAN